METCFKALAMCEWDRVGWKERGRKERGKEGKRQEGRREREGGKNGRRRTVRAVTGRNLAFSSIYGGVCSL